jgi:tagatose-6-phosphate ketose/aldose isomerase
VTTSTRGAITHGEIFGQPDLWPTSLARALDRTEPRIQTPPVLTGAGSSAYAAMAIAAAWPDARALPTTDLLLDPGALPASFGEGGVLISLARSGDSPESVGVVDLVRRLHPGARHLAITCNPQGRLAAAPGVETLLLDPRVNDRSLAVTSSFTNTVLAGLALRHADALGAALPAICRRVTDALPALDVAARRLAESPASRVTVLTPPALFGAAREAALKILEMSDGQVMAMPETILGLRHGPMTFLQENGLVLCIGSTDPRQRLYEADLFRQIREKGLGRIVVIAPAGVGEDLADVVIPASAPELPDALRTPFEMVFPQLLALHLGLRAGLNPDEPSSRGVINRVVQGVRIHA